MSFSFHVCEWLTARDGQGSDEFNQIFKIFPSSSISMFINRQIMNAYIVCHRAL